MTHCMRPRIGVRWLAKARLLLYIDLSRVVSNYQGVPACSTEPHTNKRVKTLEKK